MLDGYFNVTIVAEWLAFIASFILLDRKTGIWRLFKVFLFLTLCTETIGWYMNFILKKFNNTLPFNLLLIISISFFISVFSSANPLKKERRKIGFLNAAFLLFALFNLIFLQGLWTYNSYTETFGDQILIILSFSFFYLILRDDEPINLFRYEYFWLANGVLLYALGSVVLYIFSDALYQYYMQTCLPVYDYISYSLNSIFYGSLIVAFLWRHKTTRS